MLHAAHVTKIYKISLSRTICAEIMDRENSYSSKKAMYTKIGQKPAILPTIIQLFILLYIGWKHFFIFSRAQKVAESKSRKHEDIMPASLLRILNYRLRDICPVSTSGKRAAARWYLSPLRRVLELRKTHQVSTYYSLRRFQMQDCVECTHQKLGTSYKFCSSVQ